MASTSDSDDFESADEDLQEELKPQKKVQEVISLKTACTQELEKRSSSSEVSRNEGGGDLSLASQPQPGKSVEDVIATDAIESDFVEQSIHTEPPIERRRREQKPRVAKTGSGPKKLGTKIAFSVAATTDQTSVIDKLPAVEDPDPYTKFRGFSQPPIMQRCWVTNPSTGEVILDNNVNKVMSRADVITNESIAQASGSTQPDPYAKFRGYSEPPLIEGCWEGGVNKIPDASSAKQKVEKTKPVVVNTKEGEIKAIEEPKITEPASEQIPDPYAKFRGYSEPPLIEACWEEGVNDVVVNTREKYTKTAKEPKITEPTSEPNPDPYAKFRGYSEPPLIEGCWEDGVNKIPGASSAKQKAEDTKPVVKEGNLAPVFDKLTDSSNSSWGSWGNWSGGVTSLLSSATEGVSTLTSHVTSALESSIGMPTPEEMAQAQHDKKLLAEIKSPEPVLEAPANEEQSSSLFGFGQLMSNVTKLVETTGNKVISGGLDTLETIGKKTMEVLQEGDPGLKKKRAIFTDKTVLSQILREAKEKAEIESKELEDKQATRNIHFETLFDDYQGLVHLEALEMLSRQCGIKLESLLLANSGPALAAWQAKFQGIRDLCQLPDEEDMPDDSSSDQAEEWHSKLTLAEKSLGVPIAMGKLDNIWKETITWIDASQDESKELSTREVHEKAVSTLARLTAISVEQFHKGAELLLVQERRSPSTEADALITITTVLCSQLSSVATRFCELLNDLHREPKTDAVNSLITNIFLEASNSSSYIQEAFQLLIPILQVGLVI